MTTKTNKPKRMTKSGLADKIEWEGGFVGALEYGIHHTDVPTQIEDTWRQLETVFADFQALVTEIDYWLEH